MLADEQPTGPRPLVGKLVAGVEASLSAVTRHAPTPWWTGQPCAGAGRRGSRW